MQRRRKRDVERYVAKVRNHFETVTKVGAGFTDAELARLPKWFKPYELSEKHLLVETRVKADVWFKPARVMEVTGAQLTVSPVHTVASDRVGRGGLALRFPRFSAGATTSRQSKPRRLRRFTRFMRGPRDEPRPH